MPKAKPRPLCKATSIPSLVEGHVSEILSGESDRIRIRRDRLLQLRRHVASQIEQVNAFLRVVRRSKAFIAQVIAHVYAKGDRPGMICCDSVQQASQFADIFRSAGIHLQVSSDTGVRFDEEKNELVICVAGESHLMKCRKVQYVLHTSPPSTLGSYWADLLAVKSGEASFESTVLYLEQDATQTSGVEKYCRSRYCRHAQLVRRSRPSLIEPPRYAFSCNHCDVCLGEPRGIREEECGQLVTV